MCIVETGHLGHIKKACIDYQKCSKFDSIFCFVHFVDTSFVSEIITIFELIKQLFNQR